jgi:hypothetical protein
MKITEYGNERTRKNIHTIQIIENKMYLGKHNVGENPYRR